MPAQWVLPYFTEIYWLMGYSKISGAAILRFGIVRLDQDIR